MQGLTWKLGVVVLALMSAGMLARPAQAQLLGGWDLSVDGAAGLRVLLDSTLSLNSSDNINLVRNGSAITFNLDPNLVVDTVTASGAIKGGSGEFTGGLTAGSATIGGALQAGSATVSGALQAGSATVTNNLTAGSATVGGALQANSATVTNNLTAGSATVNGALQAGSANVTNNLTAGSATVGGALQANSATVTNNLTAGSATVNGALQAGTANVTNQLTAGSAVINGALQANSAAVTGALTSNSLSTVNLTATGTTSLQAVNVNNNKISGLADGVVSNTSTDAVSGKVLYGILNSGDGIKYFHTNSIKGDSTATGVDAVAIGPETTAQGQAALAAGLQAQAKGDSSLALGQLAKAEGVSSIVLGQEAAVDELSEGAIAIGRQASVQKDTGAVSAIAIGDKASASATNAAALGAWATAGGANALALGVQAGAGGVNSLAAGHQAQAGGSNAVALGDGARGQATGAVALGYGASSTTLNSIAIGTGAGVGTSSGSTPPGLDKTSHVAIGTNAGRNVTGNQSTAIGYDAGTGIVGDYTVSIGNEAGDYLSGDHNVSIGNKANSKASATVVEHAISIGGSSSASSRSVAIGELAQAIGQASTAVGANATASGANSVALGANAWADADSVALGANSRAEASTGVGFLTRSNSSGGSIDVVSVGSSVGGGSVGRRITNVIDGSAGTDAVNVNQLLAAQQNLADVLGQGTVVDGRVTEFQVGTKKYASVAAAFAELGAGGPGVPIDPTGAVLYDSGSNSGVVTLQGTGGTRIQNVKDGIAPTDAVNVGQLTSVVDANKAHYVSINSTGSENRENRGATGAEAIAIGAAAEATARNSLAVGREATALGENATGLGSGVEARGLGSTAIGLGSIAYDEQTVAMGAVAKSRGTNSIAIGTGAEVDSKEGATVTSNNGIAIGTDADVTADNGISLGERAVASAVRGMAFGNEAEARGVNSSASGTRARALGVDSQASGTGATASGSRSQASGTGATASGTDTVAVGTGANGHGVNGVALGTGAVAGRAGLTRPEDIANNVDMLALGARSQAEAKGSVALGSDSKTQASYGASVARYSNVNHDDSVNGVVSVGDHGGEGGVNSIQRRITNLAGGMADTDAVNVRQLRAVRDTHWSYSGNTGSTNQTMGSTVAISGGHTGAAITSNENVKTVVTPGVQGVDGNGDVVFTGGKIDIQFAETPHFKGADMGGQKITNVAAGTVSSSSMDAINGSQLYAVENKPITFSGNTGSVQRKLGETQIIKGSLATSATANASNIRTQVNAAGEVEILLANALTADSLTINNGGPVLGSGGLNMNNHKITNLTAGTADTDAVNLSQLKAVDDTAKLGWNLGVNGGVATNVAPGGAVDLSSATDNNIVITKDANNHVKFGLANNVNVGGTLTVAGVSTLTGGAHISNELIVNPNTTVNLGGNKITNVAAGVVSSTSTEAINGSQLHAVENKPITFQGNSGTTPRKLGETQVIRGSLASTAAANTSNIRTNVTGTGELEILLANALTADSLTINNGGPVLSNTGLNMNNQKITNLTDGTVDTDAVNLGQLKEVGDIANTGWKLGVNGGTANKVAPGDTVDFSSSDGNIVLTQTDKKVDLKLSDDLSLTNVTVAGNTTVNNLTATGDTILKNVNVGGDTLVVNEGNVTIKQGTTVKLGDQFTVNQGGDVHYTGPITENTHIVNKEYVDNSSQNVINNNPLTFAGTTGSTQRKLGETLNVVGSNANISTVATEGQLAIALSDDLVLNSVTTGDTKVNTDGVTVKGAAGGPDVVMNNTGFSVGPNIALTAAGLRAGTVVVSAESNDITGLSNLTLGSSDFGTKGRGATEEQLQLVRGETQKVADRSVKYDLNPDNTVNYGKVTMEGDVSTDGGRTGGTGITNVARGDISANSTDAVNGSQISDMGDSIAAGMGGGSKFVDGKLVTDLNVGGTSYNNVNDALGGLDSKIDNVGQVASAGWNIQTNGDVADKVAPGSTVQFLNGDNIEITRSGANVTVGMAQDIKVNSVVSKSVTTNELKIENGPTINQSGVNMNDKPITNLADGKAPQDAVNVRQLGQATANIQGQINHLDGRVNKVENRANAGIAAALATAGLPQAYLPGKSMFSMAGGAWNGESGYALGLSTVSDGGSWVVKGTVAGSSRGDYGGSVGVGFQW
ncbi:YadA-like family protein [Alcaligenes sp. SDU_A2]|uniref:YadA-like family protein n=1 Tax=Alcaligenes sp. SDU_A2 TaxID=3136634 RepID=UPI00311D8B9E